MPKVLNVAGGSNRGLPPHYMRWDQVLLDIDPEAKPDIVCDALKIAENVAPDSYDAVYCSHGIEHFYRHEVPVLLAGFLHVLKPGGMMELHMPNLEALLKDLVRLHLDIDDTWYRTDGGEGITFHDVLYGWDRAMKRGNTYYAHKSAYTPRSLAGIVMSAGFINGVVGERGTDLQLQAFKPCP